MNDVDEDDSINHG